MRIENIINQLDSAFKGHATKPSQCFSFENSNLFYIEDCKIAGKSVVLQQDTIIDKQNNYFKIVNQKENKIAIWAVDGCFFSAGKPPKHCDCIFFDENDFCFAEFKLNATSLNIKSVKQNRMSAIEQLKSTIELLKSKFPEHKYLFVGCKLEAYICTPNSYPKKNTSISNFAVEFLEDYGVKLYEQNFKEFN